MPTNVTLSDFLAFFAAFAIFTAVLLPPGYLFGRLSDVLSFRKQTSAIRFALALLMSLAIIPELSYLVLRAANWRVFALLGAVAVVAGLAAMLWDAFRRPTRRRAPRQMCLTVAAAVLWIVAVAGSLADLQWSGGLYRSPTGQDHLKHVAVTSAISRTGLPPQNPLSRGSQPFPLCYYYFWHLLCSHVDRLGGTFITARSAVQAGTAWAGIALACALVLVMRFSRTAFPFRRAPAPLAVALLLGSGLDLIVVVAVAAARHFVSGGGFRLPTDLQWWNGDATATAWVGAVLWVPQHVTALCVTLFGFLLLQRSVEMQSAARRWASVAVSAVAFASALGMSLWVALVGGLIGATWSALLWGANRRLFYNYLLAGLLAALFAAPFLWDIAAARQTSQFPIALGVRPFVVCESLREYFGWANDGPVDVLRLLALPVSYAIQFGFFALGGVYYWRQRRRARDARLDDWFWLIAVAASLTACAFLKATVANNDLGLRGLLFAQFGLLLWSIPLAVALLSERRRSIELRPWTRRLAMALLVTGVLGSMYDLIMLRVGGDLVIGGRGPGPCVRIDYCWNAPQGREVLEMRRAYEWIRAHTPDDAVVQHNPSLDYAYFPALYGERPMLMSDCHHTCLFNVSKDAMAATAATLDRIFGRPDLPPQQVARAAGDLHIAFLVLTVRDPAWKNAPLWDALAKPVYADESVHVYSVPAMLKAATNVPVTGSSRFPQESANHG
jgi:hypothetical protein